MTNHPFLWQRVTRAVALLLIGALILSSASLAASPVPYVIGPGDLLNVGVWNQPEVSGEFRVHPDGKVVFPLVGEMNGAGRSPAELAEALAISLTPYFLDPNVWISVKQLGSLEVSVLGEVRSPRQVSLPYGARLADAIAQSGGFLPTANRHRIQLQHAAGADNSSVVDAASYLEQGNVNGNPVLQPGDTIFVSRRPFTVDWSTVISVLTGIKLVRDLVTNR